MRSHHQPAALDRPAQLRRRGPPVRPSPEEREGYIERLAAFVEEQRARLEQLLRAYGPGSAPAAHGRYALIGQPETLVILERMETAPFLLRGWWEEKLETVFLDDLESTWGPRLYLSR